MPPEMSLYTDVEHQMATGQFSFGTVRDVTPYNISNLADEVREDGQCLGEIEHFCECVIEGKALCVTARDSRNTIEVVNALYLSAHSGEKVGLPLKESPRVEGLFAEAGERGLRFGR